MGAAINGDDQSRPLRYVALGFLLLGALGSGSLMCYALLHDDIVFSILNGLTTLGSLINLYYKLFPRIS